MNYLTYIWNFINHAVVIQKQNDWQGNAKYQYARNNK